MPFVLFFFYFSMYICLACLFPHAPLSTLLVHQLVLLLKMVTILMRFPVQEPHIQTNYNIKPRPSNSIWLKTLWYLLKAWHLFSQAPKRMNEMPNASRGCTSKTLFKMRSTCLLWKTETFFFF